VTQKCGFAISLKKILWTLTLNTDIFEREIWFLYFAFVETLRFPNKSPKKLKSRDLCAIVRLNRFILKLMSKYAFQAGQGKQKWSVE